MTAKGNSSKAAKTLGKFSLKILQAISAFVEILEGTLFTAYHRCISRK